MCYEENVKVDKQMKKALDDGVKYICWIGGDEIKNNTVTIKKVVEKSEMEGGDKNIEETIKREEVVSYLLKKLSC